MPSPLDEKNKAFDNLRKLFHCSHDQTALRLRIVTGGGKQRVEQCLKCGKPTSNSISREKAFRITGGKEPPAFDNELMQNWERRYQEKSNEIMGRFETRSAYERAEFFAWYDKYLKTERWREKRKKVLLRSQGLCEGCGVKEATQVHHLSYQHVGHELLYELVALCEECHGIAHENFDAALNAYYQLQIAGVF